MNFLRTAVRIAWRESRASSTKFFFVVIAVAIGVGSLTGVRGFSQSLAILLTREARTLMSADIAVRLNAQLSPEQAAAVEELSHKVTVTRVTETLSMVGSSKAHDPVAVQVKAVDPRYYPLYGKLSYEPAKVLPDLLQPDAVLVSDDLRLRLNVTVGDSIRVGMGDFRIAGVLISEPDRLMSGPSIGPRVMLSREGLNRTNLIQLGSRAPQRILIKAGALSVSSIRAELRKRFPDDQVQDYRDVNANITRTLDFATSFLSLVSMIALIVGGVGVATAMNSHLRQKMDSIAVMKSIGGRSGQVVQIYVVQALLLGLAGGIIGVVIGSAVQHIFPGILERYFQIKASVPWVPSSALQGIAAGLLTTLLFTVPPLLSIRQIRPALIFRRDMPEVRPSWRQRFRDSRESLLAGAGIILGVGALSLWLIGGPRDQAVRVASYFVGGLLTSLLLLAGVAWLLLRSLKAFLAASKWNLPMGLRHGIANLYRPGSHSTAILTSLGIGVMFTLTVYIVQHSMLEDIARSAPPGMANVFLLDISESQRGPLLDLLNHQPGVHPSAETVGVVSSRLVAVDGTRMEDWKVNGRTRRIGGRTVLTAAANLPQGTNIVDGHWWGSRNTAEPLVSVSEGMARYLNLKVGMELEWNAFGKPLHARLASIHRMDPHRLVSRLDFVTSPGVLQGLPTVYYCGVRVDPDRVAELQRVSFEKFPTVTVINMADLIMRIQEVVSQVSLIIRFISAFAILAGATILASSVAGTRFRRIREVVILKTLGATRARIATIFSAEFLILGTVAGLMGALLASGFSALVMKRLMKLDYHPDLTVSGLSILMTALIATVAGWLASFRILGQKPLEILREE